ncbi:MAG: hypothetical protein Q9184_003405 [Pyrenodesmia sp. 2 TL-2023]
MTTIAVRRLFRLSNNGPAPTTGSAPNIFTLLPHEIHLEIAEQLPLSSRLAFSLTCRRARELFLLYGQLSTTRAFRILLPGTIYVRRNINNPGRYGVTFSRDLCKLALQRDLFLSYVERDELAKTFFACQNNKDIVEIWLGLGNKGGRHRSIWRSHCWGYHPAEMFSEAMLRGWRHERKCKGAEGKINRSRNKSPSYGKLKALIKQRDLRICPHLKMSDRLVYGAVTEMKNVRIGLAYQALGKAETSMLKSLRKIEKKLGRASQAEASDWKGVRGCRECDTSWQFVLGDLDVTLEVYRPFNHSQGVGHPTWYRQVALPNEFDELEREWLADAERYEQNPPAWPGQRPASLPGNNQGFMHGGVLSHSQ